MIRRKVHMVGIGGIGLSGLAQLYHEEGFQVSGSDRDESPTTTILRNKGIEVFIGHEASNVSRDIELVVYSDAIFSDNVEREQAEKLGIEQVSYFEALGRIAKRYRTIAVAGTHGKTTTTAMLGTILIDANVDPTVIVGSIVSEWGSNFRYGGSDILIVEACEYRNHLLHFNPEVLVITNIEWDHTDFFNNFSELEVAFATARSNSKIVIEAKQYSKESVPDLLMPGEFNKDNARAAKAVARALFPSIPNDSIDQSLRDFKGTWRRFEYKGVLSGGAILYDDYAHHPTAVSKTIQASRKKFLDKEIVLFFQPHLYSRTRDFFSEFAEALALADRVYILPVYAARESRDPFVTSEALVKEINKRGGNARTVEGLSDTEEVLINLESHVVAFTMGAGDVYRAGDRALSKK